MNILVVTAKPTKGPKFVEHGDANIYIRHFRSCMKSIIADLVIIQSGVSPQAAELAALRTQGCFGKVIQL